MMVNGYRTTPPILYKVGSEWLRQKLSSCKKLTRYISIYEVLKAGQRRGASREDLYGCFYFFISEQLRLFAERIQQLRISFCIFDRDALDLQQAILNGELVGAGILSTTKFDRIDVSNIMDAEYIGISKVISHWCLLLASANDSTLLGTFLNWCLRQKDGRLCSSGDRSKSKRLMSEILHQLHEEGNVCRHIQLHTLPIRQC